MNDQRTQTFDPSLPPMLWVEAERAWQLPLLLSTCWWNAWVGMLWPRIPHMPHPPHRELHGQLVVPEPIEADGEHDLFA